MVSIYYVLSIFFSNYAWVYPWTDKGITITYAFQNILDKSKRHKPNKIWINKYGKFYNKSMKLWRQNNDIEMCSAYDK